MRRAWLQRPALLLAASVWQVSDGMGVRPTWSRDGREIFYRTDEGLSVVAIDISGGTFRPRRPGPSSPAAFSAT